MALSGMAKPNHGPHPLADDSDVIHVLVSRMDRARGIVTSVDLAVSSQTVAMIPFNRG